MRSDVRANHRLVTGEVVDEDVHDPLESMFTYLTERKDKNLIQEWGVWLLKWDSERALKVLTKPYLELYPLLLSTLLSSVFSPAAPHVVRGKQTRCENFNGGRNDAIAARTWGRPSCGCAVPRVSSASETKPGEIPYIFFRTTSNTRM